MPRPTRKRQRGGAADAEILAVVGATELPKEAMPVIDENGDKLPAVYYKIINPKSNFVVITYWWGRNNVNRNLNRPCPPSPIPQALPEQTYRKMIANWIKKCEAANVNHLAVEYSQFAVPGKYQKAINAKPYFIKKALELCESRAVVYIDGDMTVNRYPDIFDLQDVDFMARNWNCDPRAKDDYEDNPGADFYTFETSGGIMYFGQTPQAHHLLDSWILATELPEMAGKADDRILSLIFNNARMYLPLNFVQLPIEYLWLTMYYGDRPLDPAKLAQMEAIYKSASEKLEQDIATAPDRNAAAIAAAERRLVTLAHEINAIRKGFVDMNPINFKHNNKITVEDPWSYVFIEHPHCLTPEEIAREQSSEGAANRKPEKYNENITRRVASERGGGWFHDYIFFDSPEQAKSFLPYQHYADTHILYYDVYENENTVEEVPLFYHEPYERRYGKYNIIADRNTQMVYQLNQIMHKTPSSKKMSESCRAATSRLSAPCKIVSHATLQNGTIPEILYYLQKGLNVLYVPSKANPTYVDAVVEEANQGNNQFITVNVSKMENPFSSRELYSEYRLTLPENAPIYFDHKSKVLMHLLMICSTVNDLPKRFNESFVFLTRIRCKWVAVQPTLTGRRNEEQSPAAQAAIDNEHISDIANSVANPKTAREQAAAIATLPTEANRKKQEIANLIKKIKGFGTLGGKRKTRKNLRRRKA